VEKIPMNNLKKEKGFTIIEVVLVLAIAGLIFLMVFIALPALQRNQRDTQRKNDMGRLQTAIVSYTSSNRGALPATDAAWQAFVPAYLTTGGDSFIDPSGATTAQGDATTYVLEGPSITPVLATTYSNGGQNMIYYSPRSTCGASSDTITAAGSRKVAFRIALEGGGYHCVNN
jgi:prepilin-type N-terminal cleavage/methylation domain-containing protein